MTLLSLRNIGAALVIVIFLLCFVIAHEAERSVLQESMLPALLDQKGIKHTLEVVRTEYEHGDLTSDDCHLLLHRLGEISSSKFGVEKSMQQASGAMDICRSGFIHGLFLDVDFDEMNASKLCVNGLRNSALRLNCFHGVGHGLAVFFDYHLSEALHVCKTKVIESYQSACASGVFMEEFSPRMHLSRNATNDTFRICDEHDFKRECAWYVWIRLSEKNVSLSEGLRECAPDYRADCERGFGVLTARRMNYQQHEILSVCDSSKDCLGGAASEFGLSKELAKGISFCGRVSWSNKGVCFLEMIQAYAKHF